MTRRRKPYAPPAPKPAAKRKLRGVQNPLVDLTAPARTLSDPVQAAKSKPHPEEQHVDAPISKRKLNAYLSGVERRKQAAQAEQKATTATWDNQGVPIPPINIPFRARDILARYCRRYAIIQESINDRDYLDLWKQCDLAAVALNAWQARRNGSKP